MPYIKAEEREKYEDEIGQLASKIESDGQLNYVITKLCHNYVYKYGKKYTILNLVIGVLECAKQEFYRMIISPYENTKIQSNGDVE